MKLTKLQVVYIHAGSGNYFCDECAEYNPSKLCRLFSPADVVEPDMGCIYWKEGKPSDENVPQGLVTPKQAKLERNAAGFGCKRCEEFNREEYLCKKVSEMGHPDYGTIMPGGCCNEWEKDPIFGSIK